MDEFTNALMDLIETKTRRDKAFESCENSWGYHGYALEEELTKAQDRFKVAFRDLMMNLPNP